MSWSDVQTKRAVCWVSETNTPLQSTPADSSHSR